MLQSVVHYLDDILIHTKGVDKHIDSLEAVLKAHRTAGIKLKPTKTLLFQNQVDYLGFQVSGRDIQPTDKYVENIRNFQAPGTGKELVSLLKFFGYYCEFIPEYARLTEKMNSLRNKRHLGPDEWTEELESNFQALKNAFTDDGSPVRHFPISRGSPGGREFILCIDWSRWGMAGVLYQDQGRGPTSFHRCCGTEDDQL